MSRVFLVVAVAAGVLVLSWALMTVLARRLPPGSAKDLASVLPACLTTIKRLRRDERVPRRAKLAIAFAGLWVLSPIDLIPEFIPFLGPLDDAVVAALVLRHVLRTTDRAILAEHWRGDPATLDTITSARRQRSERTADSPS